MSQFRHVGIVVSDMERALRFYRDYLGLEVTGSFPSRSGSYMSRLTALADVQAEIHVLEDGKGCKVELLQFHSHPEGRGTRARLHDVGRSHVAFTVAELDTLYAARREADVRFQTPPIDSPDGVRVCFCFDPDGTLIELVQCKRDGN